MEEISELIKIVTAHTKKNLPLLDLKAQDDHDNKELNLFLGVKSGEYDSDQSASKGIYGEDSVDFKFRMLKSRLNRKLLNHLFFVDFDSIKAHKSTTFYQECQDYLYFSRMLLKLGNIRQSTKLLYKIVDLARECEFNDILHECLLLLRDIYSATYRPKLFQSIQEEIKTNKSLLDKEEAANAIFYESKLQLNSSLTNRKKDLGPLHNDLKKLKKLSEETGSINIFVQLVKLSLWIFEQEGQFSQSLAFIEDIEGRFKKGKLNVSRFDPHMLVISKLYALLKLRRYQEGTKLAKDHLPEIEKDNAIWMSIMENYLLCSIAQKKYADAIDILLEISGSKSYESLDELSGKKWDIYAGYLFWLTGEKSLLKKFNFADAVNKIPEFQKDDAGINVALLNLQFLLYLDGDTDRLHAIVSAMDDYVSKYLNNSFSKRAKIFFKLISKIIAHNRDFEMVIRKSKYLAEKLNESETEGDVFADLEVVPYEHLWDHILKRLSVLRYQLA